MLLLLMFSLFQLMIAVAVPTDGDYAASAAIGVNVALSIILKVELFLR